MSGTKRRAEGSVQERPDGTWRIFVSAGNGENGQRRRVSEVVKGTRRDANRRLAELAQAIRTGAYTPDGAQTLSRFVAEWWPGKAASVAPRTADSYRQMLDAYILPALGAKRLAKVTPGEVAAMIGGVVARGHLTQAAHVHTLAKIVFNGAVKQGAIVRNPAAAVDRPRPPHREMATVSPDEWQRVRQYLEERESWALLPLTVAIATGLRRSEVLGLQWRDIDFGVARLTVRRTFHTLPGRGAVIEAPKSHRSLRPVSLDRGTLAALAEHRQQAERAARMLGLRFRETDFVFAGEDGSPWRPSSLTRAWRRTAKALGIKARLHDLRHSAATLLLSRGCPIRLVSERLGHASAGFTLDTYAHVLPGAQAAAAEDLAALLAGDGERKALPAG